jgi:hypothetical protein
MAGQLCIVEVLTTKIFNGKSIRVGFQCHFARTDLDWNLLCGLLACRSFELHFDDFRWRNNHKNDFVKATIFEQIIFNTQNDRKLLAWFGKVSFKEDLVLLL